MSTYLRPVMGPNENNLMMHGHLRLLEPSYLKTQKKKSFYNLLE